MSGVAVAHVLAAVLEAGSATVVIGQVFAVDCTGVWLFVAWIHPWKIDHGNNMLQGLADTHSSTGVHIREMC